MCDYKQFKKAYDEAYAECVHMSEAEQDRVAHMIGDNGVLPIFDDLIREAYSESDIPNFRYSLFANNKAALSSIQIMLAITGKQEEVKKFLKHYYPVKESELAISKEDYLNEVFRAGLTIALSTYGDPQIAEDFTDSAKFHEVVLRWAQIGDWFGWSAEDAAEAMFKAQMVDPEETQVFPGAVYGLLYNAHFVDRPFNSPLH
jgi:hypothetical protein